MIDKVLSGKGWLAASAAAILLAAVMGWTVFSANSAAAAANTISVDPAAQTVAPNGEFTVKIMAEPVAGKLIGSWDIRVKFNAAVLDATACAGVASGALACNADFAAGEASFNGASGDGLSGAQTLGTVTFKAIGAAGTSSDVTITVVSFNDADLTPMSPATAKGTVNIAAPATATPTPLVTPKVPPNTGGAPTDGSSSVPWALGVLGLAVLAGGVWVTARTRRATL
jgi:uncharacterized protein (TIGR02588 family)